MKNLKQPRALESLSNLGKSLSTFKKSPHYLWKNLSNLGKNLGTLKKNLSNLGKSLNTFKIKAQSTLKSKYLKTKLYNLCKSLNNLG